jgi:hypothetical protein
MADPTVMWTLFQIHLFPGGHTSMHPDNGYSKRAHHHLVAAFLSIAQPTLALPMDMLYVDVARTHKKPSEATRSAHKLMLNM